MADLKTHSVPAVERALTILETLVESKRGRTLPEIARLLKLPKSSAHCLLLTLERCGYLRRQRETRRYMFALKFFALANMALAGLELNEMAAPVLKTLMEQTRMTVHMAVLERDEAILIHKVEPPGLLKLATWVGKRMDVHCTGTGKAILAHLPEEQLLYLMKERRMPRHNENTIISARKLREELETARKRGYAIDDEEDEVGLRCIGSPVFDHTGRVVAAVSISGTINQITSDNVPSLAEKVKQAAARISQRLGYASTTIP
jgi:DNA-binding IclR family transcriptional regulator